MFETNLIVYVVRKGYEIKTWINVEKTESDESIERKARDKFKSLGVKLTEDETFEWEWY